MRIIVEVEIDCGEIKCGACAYRSGTLEPYCELFRQPCLTLKSVSAEALRIAACRELELQVYA